MNRDKKLVVSKYVKRLISTYDWYNRLSVDDLFDPHQTHAVYGITSKEELESIKTRLKRVKANR